jgi:hypothetical protein
MGKTFSDAEERVDSDSWDDIVAVLIGESSWKFSIRAATEEALKNVSSNVFEVLPPDEYKKVLAKLDPKANPNDTPGVTDKKEGRIHMSGYFGTKSRESMLGLSLHEAVHLISHRPGKSSKQHSSAIGVLGEGLLEGLVELITTDILSTQGITLASPKKRGHQQRVPVVIDLMSTYGITISMLARPLFRGDSEQLFRLMEAAFTTAGWIEVQRLTSDNNPNGAIRRMAALRAAEEKAHPGAFRTRMQQAGPRVVAQFQQVFR